MKVARFTESGRTRLGVVTGDHVADVGHADPSLPDDLGVLLAIGGLSRVADLAANAPLIALADVVLEAPIAQPPTFLAIGLNYSAHVAESGMPKPDVPVVFNKQITCVTGPSGPIEVPTVAPDWVDYEGELGVVIGQRCRSVKAADARRRRRRLPRRQRRLRARLAARDADDDDGQELGHPRPDRTVAGHHRRDHRPARPRGSARGSTTTCVRTRRRRR